MSGALKGNLENVVEFIHEPLREPIITYLQSAYPEKGHYASKLKLVQKYGGGYFARFSVEHVAPGIRGRGILAPWFNTAIAEAQWDVGPVKGCEVGLQSFDSRLPEDKLGELLKQAGLKERMDELYTYVRKVFL